jgi:hypothetical protein
MTLEPEKTMRKLQEDLGEKPKAMRGFNQGVGPNELKVSNSNTAAQKIRTKSYLKDYNKQQLRRACELLDDDLMEVLGYDDCAGAGGGATA